MADILLFPAGRASTAAHRGDAPRSPAAAPPDAETWSEDHAGDNGDLEMVASLAAAPCQSLVGLVDKMQVLVTRLAPDDDPDAGLCITLLAGLELCRDGAVRLGQDQAFDDIRTAPISASNAPVPSRAPALPLTGGPRT